VQVTIDTQGVVLLDLDGVLIDNRAFEQAVSSHIVENLARSSSAPLHHAQAIWANELATTRGDHGWYDYAFHCMRLGIDPSVVPEAHRRNRRLLRPVRGARETVELLHTFGIEFGIVSDATMGVIEFKLDVLRLRSPATVVSSDFARATKAEPAYWELVAKQAVAYSPVALVDNRASNLDVAKVALPTVDAVYFARQEHVTTLPRSVAPRQVPSGHNSFVVVRNHSELSDWFRSRFSKLVRGVS